jgi:hypothetical protein
MNESIEDEMRDMSESLKRIEDMTEENQRMIKRLHFAYRFSALFSIVRWVIIIGVTLGAFYYLQPYLEGVLKLYGSVNSLTGGIENNGGIDILKALKGQ